jgi:regulator of CtrA degradation
MSGWPGESRSGGGDRGFADPGVLSFVSRHAGSEGFKALFKEGMGLVEAAASYLDGPGRQQSRALSRPAALAYATESMRLTTRLMQMASWLLLRRAVAEGELTPAQAASDKHRVRLTRQDVSCGPEMLAQLPQEFIGLCERSLRLQARVLHLDRSINGREPIAEIAPRPVEAQWAKLRAAFSAQVSEPVNF